MSLTRRKLLAWLGLAPLAAPAIAALPNIVEPAANSVTAWPEYSISWPNTVYWINPLMVEWSDQQDWTAWTVENEVERT